MSEVPDQIIPQVSVNITYPDSKQCWEYKYIPLASIETLNELGAIGWQAVMYLQPSNSFLMIRQIIPDLEEIEQEEEADRILG